MVLDHEHPKRTVAVGGRGLARRRRLPPDEHRTSRRGKQQSHRGAFAGGGIDLETSTDLVGESGDHRQTEPRAAFTLGREERSRRLCQHIGWHAGSVVGDLEHDHRTPAFILFAGAADADRDAPLPVHRVTRVDQNIEHRLLQLVGIALDRRELRLEFERERLADHRPEDRPREFQRAVERGDGVDLTALRPAGLAEHQEVLREGPTTRNRLLDRVERLAGTFGEIGRRRGERGVSQHRRKHVVEIVREPRGHLTDRLELAGGGERVLDLVGLGLVGDDADDSSRGLHPARELGRVVSGLVLDPHAHFASP